MHPLGHENYSTQMHFCIDLLVILVIKEIKTGKTKSSCKKFRLKYFVISFSLKVKIVVKDIVEAEVGDDFGDLGDISDDYL